LGEFCKPQRRQDFPCYVLAPQCPKGEKWSDVDWSQEKVVASPSTSAPLQQTFDVVDSMLEDAAIDKNSVYICGLSMGGFGTWDALARRPDFFAAAIPICGGGDTTTASKFPSVPIWCFHGDQDKTVNVERSREMVAALKKAGGEPRYTEYPGVGHDSWTQTFADEATFRWLFGQRRTPAPR
jgi:predicted peptidase